MSQLAQAKAKQASQVEVTLPKKNDPPDWWQLVGQIPQGLAMSTFASSQSEEDRLINGKQYRPALIDQPGAFINLAKQGIDLAKVAAGYEAGEPFDPEGYVGKSIERLGSGNDRVNDSLGINNPENIAELGFNILGSVVVPEPLSKAKAAGKLGKFGEGLEAVEQYSKNLGIVGKIAHGSGKAVFELAVPLRNTPIKFAAPISVAFGGALQEGVDTALKGYEEYEKSDSYKGIAEYFATTSTVAKPDGDFYPKEVESVFISMFNKNATAEELSNMMASQGYDHDPEAIAEAVLSRDIEVANGTFKPLQYEIDPADEEKFVKALENKGIYTTIPDIQRLSRVITGTTLSDHEAGLVLKSLQDQEYNGSIVVDNTEVGQYKDEETANRLGANSTLEPVDAEPITISPWVAAGVALAGAGLGYRYIRNARMHSSSLLDPDAIIGSTTLPSQASFGDKLMTNIVESDYAINANAKKAMSPENAEITISAKNRVNNAQAIGAKTNHVIKTGEFPNSTVRGTPIGPLLRSYGKDLDAGQQQKLGDALLAATELDDIRKLKGTQPGLNALTPAELEARVAAVKADPVLSKYFDASQNMYHDMIKYLKDGGMIDETTYIKMRRHSPNYVPMKRDFEVEGLEPNQASNADVTGESAVADLLSRSTERYGGVQQGAVINPVEYGPIAYTKAVRAVEHNKFRKDFIDRIDPDFMVKDSQGNPVPLVKKIEVKDVKKLNSKERIIATYTNGEASYYKIGQGDLYEALKFDPRNVQPILNAIRTTNQSFTTGIMNLAGYFRLAISPMFDSQTAMLARPTGTQVGFFSEILNRAGVGTKVGPVDLGSLDPSAPFAFLTGAARGIVSDMAGASANAIATSLMRSNSLIRNTLGNAKALQLRDYLQKVYDNSYRAMLDAEGVTSSSGYGAGLEHKTDIGLEYVAPELATQTSAKSVRQQMDVSKFKGLVAASKHVGVKLRASAIGRAYETLLRNMQDGTRIQYAATNMHKAIDEDGNIDYDKFSKLMHDTRAITGDPAQGGKSELVQTLNSGVMYHNVAVQEIATYARKAKADPVSFAANMASTIGLMVAFRYGAMALGDEDAIAGNEVRNPMQKATGFTTFGGTEIAITPAMRVLTAPIFATLDQLMTLPDGTLEPSFAKTVIDMFNGDLTPRQLELAAEARAQAFNVGAGMLSPVQGNSVPIANGVAAFNGVDLNASAMFDDPTGPYTIADKNPLLGKGELSDSIMSSYASNLIESTIGSGIATYILMLDDFYRATSSDNLQETPATSAAAGLRIGLSRVEDRTRAMNSPFEGLFGNYTKAKSIATAEFTLADKKAAGLENLQKSFNRNIRDAGFTGATTGSGKKSVLPSIREQDLPDFSNSMLDLLGQSVLGKESPLQLTTKLARIQRGYSALTQQLQDIRSSKTTSIEERNRAMNEINEKRKLLIDDKLITMRLAEDQIRLLLQDDGFVLQDLTPEYLEKLAKTLIDPSQYQN